MPDNINLGGDSSGGDIGFNIYVGLNNIERSTEEAATLADTISSWTTGLEAAADQSNDTLSAFAKLTEEGQKRLEIADELLAREKELRDISSQVRQNVKDTADAYRDMSGTLNNLANNMNVMGSVFNGGNGSTAAGGGGNMYGLSLIHI